MLKIYTKTGDRGQTGLYGGKRVSKAELRIEAYGTVDELNSFLGLLASLEVMDSRRTFLHEIQSDLFTVGALLAKDPDKDMALAPLEEKEIIKLEKDIDVLQQQLPELKSFVLPGGSLESSYAQVARSICRRAERRVVQLANEGEVPDNIIQYLNRLSDYLFVLARYIIYTQGKQEIPWKPSS